MAMRNELSAWVVAEGQDLSADEAEILGHLSSALRAIRSVLEKMNSKASSPEEREVLMLDLMLKDLKAYFEFKNDPSLKARLFAQCARALEG